MKLVRFYKKAGKSWLTIGKENALTEYVNALQATTTTVASIAGTQKNLASWK